MVRFALAFLCGDLLLQTQGVLPCLTLIIIIAGIGLLGSVTFRKNIFFLIVSIASLGFAFSGWWAVSYFAGRLHDDLEGKNLFVRGIITSIPVTSHNNTQFNFYLEKISTDNKLIKIERTIKLNWRGCPYKIAPGNRMQLILRLKRIHGVHSPGAFDAEKWALHNNITALGYVIKSSENKFLHPTNHYLLMQIRNRIFDKLQEIMLPINGLTFLNKPWLIALITGERQQINSRDWQVLRKTGTNHLMAIAGLHIGIIASIAHFIITSIWRRSIKLCLYFPAQHAGAVGALILAIFYSALAGFSLPTQRACFMFMIFVTNSLLQRKGNLWSTWALALLLVLLVNPTSVLTDSFWLSFGTIAIIIYGMCGRYHPQNFWWKWGRVQWIVGIGLIPLSLTLFYQVSVVSFIANTIAIPWLSFFILPFCLLGCAIMWAEPNLGSFFFRFADFNLYYLWKILTWLSQFYVFTFSIPNYLVLFFIVLGVLIFLLPRGFYGKSLGLVFFIPTFYSSNSLPQPGEYWVSVLDVGQGLSIVVRTATHTLLFDAGAKYLSHDMGESVIIPYLNSLNIPTIDALVISHGDNDHIGGAYSVLDNYKIKFLYTSVPLKFTHTKPLASLCNANYNWEWDNVRFTFLHPTKEFIGKGNNSSCVLKISNNKKSTLLTGDIEKNAEYYLTQNQNENLQSAILISPHHGSKTSSTRKFMAAVNPQIVIHSTGYKNRYHFPHKQTLERYKKSLQLNTAETGTIKISVGEGVSINSYNINNQHYWMQ